MQHCIMVIDDTLSPAWIAYLNMAILLGTLALALFPPETTSDGLSLGRRVCPVDGVLLRSYKINHNNPCELTTPYLTARSLHLLPLNCDYPKLNWAEHNNLSSHSFCHLSCLVRLNFSPSVLIQTPQKWTTEQRTSNKQ